MKHIVELEILMSKSLEIVDVNDDTRGLRQINGNEFQEESKMGRFSTTTQIRNNTDRAGFISAFNSVMEKHGFVPCAEDEAAKSYLLAFSDGWVTLASEEYRDNPRKAYDDSKGIAAALKTSAFTVEVVDSDFGILNLFTADGGEDEVIVGDGSGYGIEEPARGNRKYWMPLLADGKTWEQFSEIVEQENTFVEETLGNLAAVFGIDAYYIDADFDEIMEKADGGDVTAFYFKKAAAKVKTMSLNAAFVKVFGEGLEPLGFKRLKNIKTKYPYFVRVVGNEILHIVSYRQISSPKLGYKNIEIYCGVVTLYRRKIDFTRLPEDWLENIVHIFRDTPDINIDCDVMERAIQFKCDLWGIDKDLKLKRQTLNDAFFDSIEFLCNSADSEAMLYGLKNAFDITKSIILAAIDKVTDLDSCINYFYLSQQHGGGWMELCPFDEFISDPHYSNSEGLVLIKANYRNDGAERLKQTITKRISHLSPYSTQDEVEMVTQRLKEEHKKQTDLRFEMLDNPELNKRVLEECERVKANNIEMLKSYGISINL